VLLKLILTSVFVIQFQSVFAEDSNSQETNKESTTTQPQTTPRMGMKSGMGMMKNMAMRPKFEDVDTNKDGNITKEELMIFRAQRQSERVKEGRMLKHASLAPSFEDLDKNQDKVLSKDEFPPAMPLTK
jgi:hypothetical protein